MIYKTPAAKSTSDAVFFTKKNHRISFQDVGLDWWNHVCRSHLEDIDKVHSKCCRPRHQLASTGISWHGHESKGLGVLGVLVMCPLQQWKMAMETWYNDFSSQCI